ncbi:transposable element Tcb1 transposase [Trichonephila clavipes]|nr:transposable element Tcb1 transposase [Trichonephila clavipes]
MRSQIYQDVILEQHVRLFRSAMGVEFVFMDEHACPHRATIDKHGRWVAARQKSPACLLEFRRIMLDKWCNIPQYQIDNLVLSMPKRCKACIALSGRHTPY